MLEFVPLCPKSWQTLELLRRFLQPRFSNIKQRSFSSQIGCFQSRFSTEGDLLGFDTSQSYLLSQGQSLLYKAFEMPTGLRKKSPFK